MPLRTTKIPHGLAWIRTRASTITSRRLTEAQHCLPSLSDGVHGITQSLQASSHAISSLLCVGTSTLFTLSFNSKLTCSGSRISSHAYIQLPRNLPLPSLTLHHSTSSQLSIAIARGGNLCGSPSTGPIITENFTPFHLWLANRNWSSSEWYFFKNNCFACTAPHAKAGRGSFDAEKSSA